MSDDLNYATLYAQKQEQYVVELIRKLIDFDVRATFISMQLKQIEEKFEESQKQVELQNDMMEKAAESIKVLTTTKDDLNTQVKELEGEITGWKKRADTLNEKNIELMTENEQLKVKLKGCEREVDRQKTELSDFQKEIKSLKKESGALDNTP